MITFLIIIIILLIIIFIVYSFYALQEKDAKIKYYTNLNLYRTICKTKFNIKSDYLQPSDTKIYALFYDMSLNCVYWTIGIYNEKCNIDEINMGSYKTPEDGDTLIILIGNNVKNLNLAKEKIILHHNIHYSYKKLFFNYMNTYDAFYFNINMFSNKFDECDIPDLKLKEFKFEECDNKYEHCFKKQKIEISKNRQCEELSLFKKAKKGLIPHNYHKIKVLCDDEMKDSPLSCLINKSDIIELKSYINNSQFKIIAVDHFKSRAALHSNIVCYNAENDSEIRLDIVSEIVDKINELNSITIRLIQYCLPDNINSIYFREFIYYDFSTGNKPNINSIIPMHVYKLI